MATATMRIEAELRAPVAAAQLVHYRLDEPADNLQSEDASYRLDLCLTPRPRNARACYPQRWGRDRFERLGKVFVVPPGELLHSRSDERGEQASLLFQLDPSAMQERLEQNLAWDARYLSAGLDVRDVSIQMLLMRLAEEAKSPGFASEMLVELIASQLAIELSRYQQRIVNESSSGGLAQWRLKLIDERIREAPSMPTLDELAGLCGLSVRQLTRGFRSSKACSIGDYVANSRIELAKEMLSSDSSIKAISYTLGFSSPSGFCYAFRRASGETPGQYRQRILRCR
ncbi:helix-turn-helix transcriptional regulator [Zhongshania aquimaris]|uniref:Helix-turn-helix transcriptional regulator n=1 Tax=Zhongshania aquimaris TaxID=2857107 RepID=A0ABS6VW29_9GAMM|nr:AraC family transcriptional regulator [Zhongshania aquimaris]MBW2942528.1 helix-turn-helix transcriptional regulator [Zhongshania aquimaris]